MSRKLRELANLRNLCHSFALNCPKAFSTSLTVVLGRAQVEVWVAPDRLRQDLICDSFFLPCVLAPKTTTVRQLLLALCTGAALQPAVAIQVGVFCWC